LALFCARLIAVEGFNALALVGRASTIPMRTTTLEPSDKTDKTGEHGRVSITIDGQAHSIRRGMHELSELKKLGSVPADYALDQVIDGKFEPLPDNGKVHIRGDEVFVSHPKDSASS
jgi:hypothetical protein